jgi:hypothetical protein
MNQLGLGSGRILMSIVTIRSRTTIRIIRICITATAIGSQD